MAEPNSTEQTFLNSIFHHLPEDAKEVLKSNDFGVLILWNYAQFIEMVEDVASLDLKEPLEMEIAQIPHFAYKKTESVTQLLPKISDKALCLCP